RPARASTPSKRNSRASSTRWTRARTNPLVISPGPRGVAAGSLSYASSATLSLGAPGSLVGRRPGVLPFWRGAPLDVVGQVFLIFVAGVSAAAIARRLRLPAIVG